MLCRLLHITQCRKESYCNISPVLEQLIRNTTALYCSDRGYSFLKPQLSKRLHNACIFHLYTCHPACIYSTNDETSLFYVAVNMWISCISLYSELLMTFNIFSCNLY